VLLMTSVTIGIAKMPVKVFLETTTTEQL